MSNIAATKFRLIHYSVFCLYKPMLSMGGIPQRQWNTSLLHSPAAQAMCHCSSSLIIMVRQKTFYKKHTDWMYLKEELLGIFVDNILKSSWMNVQHHQQANGRLCCSCYEGDSRPTLVYVWRTHVALTQKELLPNQGRSAPLPEHPHTVWN